MSAFSDANNKFYFFECLAVDRVRIIRKRQEFFLHVHIIRSNIYFCKLPIIFVTTQANWSTEIRGFKNKLGIQEKHNPSSKDP